MVIFRCQWCGATEYGDDPEAEVPCIRCSTYWLVRMGWVPRVPMMLDGQTREREPSREWVFTDSRGRVVAVWPPPPASGADLSEVG